MADNSYKHLSRADNLGSLRRDRRADVGPRP
jgi:hypothetical protein